MSLFTFLLEPREPFAVSSAAACFDALTALDGRFPSSIDRAAAGGSCADRLGYAFLAGYRAALATLLPGHDRTSLCATEEGGAHPRAIRTTLTTHGDELWLSGKKTFATLASAATTLIVIASAGTEGERNRLRAAHVPAARAGVVIRDRAPLHVAPEIPHAEVTFTDVLVHAHELLDGDGYADVLKPFRTLEDAHVTAAWLGYAVRTVADQRTKELALALIAGLRNLDLERNASSAETHVVLAGILAQATAVATACDGMPDVEARARWFRDKPLLDVAGTARALRIQAAWRELAARSEMTSFG